MYCCPYCEEDIDVEPYRDFLCPFCRKEFEWNEDTFFIDEETYLTDTIFWISEKEWNIYVHI